MADPPTAAAVQASLRLAFVNARLQEKARAQLEAREAARARLLAAVDRQRAGIAARLRTDVVAPIEAARALVPSRPGAPEVPADDPLQVARQELELAGSSILDIVEGVPPAALGGGRIRAALRDLARRAPLVVTVHATEDATGDEGAERALYYVCSEAFANAAKHSAARRVTVDLRRAGDELVLLIDDDGAGGADPMGSGLRGLADRLAALGGRLRVDSPLGAGTRLRGSPGSPPVLVHAHPRGDRAAGTAAVVSNHISSPSMRNTKLYGGHTSQWPGCEWDAGSSHPVTSCINWASMMKVTWWLRTARA